MKVKTRVPVPSIATSGRWSKRADGEWGFDLDDYPATKTGSSESEQEAQAAAALTAAAASGKLTAGDPSDDEDEDDANYEKTVSDSNIHVNITNNSSQQAAANPSPTVAHGSNVNSSSGGQDVAPIHLVLRMRDEKRELQDIKFDFLPNKDTVDEISHELVNAKLIDAIDMVAVSANLNKILENKSLSPITFPLVSFKIFFSLFFLLTIRFLIKSGCTNKYK